MLLDKLFIVDPSKFSDKEVKDPTYCAFERQDDSIEGVEYIRKDALLKWINEARAIPHENAITRDLAFQEVVNKLNEM